MIAMKAIPALAGYTSDDFTILKVAKLITNE
jgi:hypothetical protein